MVAVITFIKTTRDYCASFLLGAALVFAFAPFSFWFLPFLILPVFLLILNKKQPLQAAKVGLSFGAGWFLSGIGWVFISIDQFGGLPIAISILLMCLLALYLALFPALACYLASKLSSNTLSSVALLPLTWLLSEVLRGYLLTGFPWLSLGYSQTQGPFKYFAPVVGEFGLTFIILLTASALYFLFNSKNKLTPSVFIGFTLITTALLSNSVWVNKTNKEVKVALIQGNIAQSMRWTPDQNWPTMMKYLDLARKHYEADLIIWPEAAVPALEPLAQEYLSVVDQGAFHNNTAIITGIIDYNIESKNYFNSLIVLGKKTADDKSASYYYHSSNQYYKHHLLPIGEFVPFEDFLRPIAPLFNLPMSSFSRGDYQQKNLIANGFNIAPLICFEIAFSHQLAENITKDTDFILTVSNDAWFGNSHGPHQHLEIAQMRALEFGRPVLRATNNGITAVINDQGKIIGRIPQFEEAVLNQTVQLVTGKTPYSIYGNSIVWLSYLVLAVTLMFRHFLAHNRAHKQIS